MSMGVRPVMDRLCREHGGGFSLLELLVTLAVIGLAGGLVAMSSGRVSSRGAQAAAVRSLTQQLNLARVEAMRSGEAVSVSWRAGDDELNWAMTGAGEKRWPAKGLVCPASVVRFEASGRTSARVVRFADQRAPAEALCVVEFDPVSGAPHARRASEPSPFTEVSDDE